MLFGAEITATLHYKERYNSSRNPFDDESGDINFTFYNSIQFLVLLYSHQSKNKTFIDANEVKKRLELAPIQFDLIKQKLIDEKFIVKVENELLAPCFMPTDLSLYDIYEKIAHESYNVPYFVNKQGFVIKIAEQLKEISNFSKQTLSNIKFSELLN